ncbi:MAG: hypothetical protein ACTSU5_15210 [Promethearchaeota archaeon]
MAKFPKVKLEKLEISKIVCGTNPFLGISHFTVSRDLFLKEYFTADRVVEIMSYLQEEFGVNAVISSPRDEIAQAIEKVEEETGERYQWLCTPSNSRVTARGLERDLHQQIQWCADNGVAVCMPHRSYTDQHMVVAEGRIDGIEDYLAQIRDLGMVPGLSTHYYETLKIVKKRDYDVSLVVQPVNTLGFQSNIEVNTLANIIRSFDRQVIAIKPFAAGRLLPEVGLNFTLNNIKENDLVAMGVDNIQNADYDCQVALGILGLE